MELRGRAMLGFSENSDNATDLYLISKEACDDWLDTLDPPFKTWLQAMGFKGQRGKAVVVPEDAGKVAFAVGGLGGNSDAHRHRFVVANIAKALPQGTYRIATKHGDEEIAEHSLAWLLSSYSFDTYRAQLPHKAELICPDGADELRLSVIANGEALARDLINTPAADMGPTALQSAVENLANEYGATVDTIAGDDLLTQNFPMIHAVGRAADEPPRLIDMSWGDTGPSLVLVGKGVCFDTGGLNIKPGASMGLMKKDMGGAANVMGLAYMIMALKLPLRLRVLIPAVENSIDGSAFRPQDILKSRKGLTVEINNTDAEGRLVLADAIALADETPPDLMICMATLTGAARVALGPDIAPYYTDSDDFSDALQVAAERVRDPVWRMPFHDPYESMIEPGIADLDNAPKGGFAGSITAGLFLRRFVEDTEKFAHFDIYGWSPSSLPGRPKGGAGQGIRSILEALPKALSL